jgi:SAM-dependent methyltransferase
MFPELYHAHHNRYAEDIPFWLDLAAQVGDPLLELGCGTGRVLVPLTQAGYQCIGIDHDLAMLRFLQAQVGKLKHNPQFFAADMTRFNLSIKFALIVLPCNTFSTLSRNERIRCLRCVHRHLKPGGCFAVSIPNPVSLVEQPERSESELEDEFLHPRTGNPVQVSSSWERTENTFQLTWAYDELFPDGKVERFTAHTIHHIQPVDEYLGEIREAGLEIIEVYGGFDQSSYSGKSPYLISVAKR